jgi:hypothetical protein
MHRRPITHVFVRAAEIFAPEEKKPRVLSIGERMEWMRGGAALVNIRMLPASADVMAAGMPFGYWRGLHPRVRAGFEVELFSRGQQLRAGEPRYQITVVGMRHARTLQRAARRLIALASEADEKVIEIVHAEVGRRCGTTVATVVAQPLRLEPVMEALSRTRERRA